MAKIYTTLHSEINKVLMEWNPIGVNESSLKDEYLEYVTEIMEVKNNFANLVIVLENILVNDIGLNYQADNINHKKELLFYAYKIFIMPNDE